MPGTVDGFQLARIAQTMCPHVMVIVVSGGVRPGFSGLAPDARFVPKPHRADLIVRMIPETTGAHWLGPDLIGQAKVLEGAVLDNNL